MATPVTPPTPGKSGQVDLNTLVAAIQNAVQAQNLIATNLKSVMTAITSQTAVLAAAFPTPTVASSAWTPGGILNGASATISFAVTGVTLGQFVKASLSIDLLGCDLGAYVQASNNVVAVIQNNTGGTVTFGVATVKVSVAST